MDNWFLLLIQKCVTKGYSAGLNVAGILKQVAIGGLVLGMIPYFLDIYHWSAQTPLSTKSSDTGWLVFGFLVQVFVITLPLYRFFERVELDNKTHTSRAIRMSPFSILFRIVIAGLTLFFTITSLSSLASSGHISIGNILTTVSNWADVIGIYATFCIHMPPQKKAKQKSFVNNFSFQGAS